MPRRRRRPTAPSVSASPLTARGGPDCCPTARWFSFLNPTTKRRLTPRFRVCCQRACVAVSAPAAGEHAPPHPQAPSASGGFWSCSSPPRKPGRRHTAKRRRTRARCARRRGVRRRPRRTRPRGSARGSRGGSIRRRGRAALAPDGAAASLLRARPSARSCAARCGASRRRRARRPTAARADPRLRATWSLVARWAASAAPPRPRICAQCRSLLSPASSRRRCRALARPASAARRRPPRALQALRRCPPRRRPSLRWLLPRPPGRGSHGACAQCPHAT